MPLPLSAIVALAQTCAPIASPTTLAAIVIAESGGSPLAIGVNGNAARRIEPHDLDDAVAVANHLLAAGASIDLGLGQINSRNLRSLGMTVRDAFDPCRNLLGSARVLSTDYTSTSPALEDQSRLRVSLSLYNTGDPRHGFRNGYVDRVTAAVRTVVPALDPTAPTDRAARPTTAPAPPTWDVFGRAGAASFVLIPQTAGAPQ